MSLQQLLTYTHEVIQLLWLDICHENNKIRWSDEGRDFNGIPFIIFGTKVLDCQHEKERKAPGKMKAKETKAEKMVNLLFLK